MAPFRPARVSGGVRGDLAAVAAAVGLVVAAAVVGRQLLAEGADLVLPFPPLLATWLPHLGPGTPAALVIAVAVTTRGPAAAERMAWRPLLLSSWAAATAWTLALALVDGWQRGVVERLTSDDEYLHDVPRAPGITVLLRQFADHILTRDVDPTQTWFWTTHVGAHPPGVFLIFVVLDRIGLGGGGPAGLLVILVGASAGAAIAVTARALGDEARGRRALPYAVLLPGAVWVGVSADGMFAGWLAWGVALLAVGTAGRGWRADLAAVAGGLLLGGALFLSYGLVLGGLLPLAVVVVRLRQSLLHPADTRSDLDRRSGVDCAEGRSGSTVTASARRPIPRAVDARRGLEAVRRFGASRAGRGVVLATVGALLVVAAFTLAGFSWLDGYAKVRVIYAASIAAHRPYSYFVWANLAAFGFAVGPAAVAGLRRAAARSSGPGPTTPVDRSVLLLVAAAAAAVLVADLSGMSKAEVERIWLPFAVWTAIACADLPHPRRWLAAQAGAALLVNHLLLTVW